MTPAGQLHSVIELVETILSLSKKRSSVYITALPGVVVAFALGYMENGYAHW